jgi:hypothetical protein
VPTGGELTQAIGLQLQSQSPGNNDNGNFNVTGVGIMQKGAYPCWQPTGGTLSIFARMMALGQTSTWTFSGIATQNNYQGGVAIGSGINFTSNVNGNPNGSPVIIGDGHNIFGGQGVTIGYTCTNGNSSGYPNAWAHSIVIGFTCIGKTMDNAWGSVIIGSFNQETLVGSTPTGPNVFIGNTIVSSTQAGKNIVIGTGVTQTGTNNINLGHWNLAGFDTFTENNTIRIGDFTHTAVTIGPVTLAPKPTITGSRAGNAALADLLTKLAAMNLIIDSTTA